MIVASVVLLVIVALLIAILTRPATFRLVRSTTIAAPAHVVFGLINDFHAWARWNPFLARDPDQQVTVSGAPSGVGAKYAWNGKQAGAGTMEILESRSPAFVKIRLAFMRPFRATNITEFTIEPAVGSVSLTWAMSGSNNFFGKTIALFSSMERMVGPDFERGLAAIKREAEAASPAVVAPPNALGAAATSAQPR